MRGVMAFLVWVLSFWTWLRALFTVRWLKAPPLDQGRVDSSVGVEQSRSDEGEHESALAAFLSSLRKGGGILIFACDEAGTRLEAFVDGDWRELSMDEATHREFLAAVASSKVECRDSLYVDVNSRNFEMKRVEEIVGALVPNNNFNRVTLELRGYSAVQMAECVSNLLSGNKAIEILDLELEGSTKVVGKEAAELLANGLRENRVLRTLDLEWTDLDDEGVEVLAKPLKDNDTALESLWIRGMTDVGLEHLGVMLGTNTSLKTLGIRDRAKVDDLGRTGDESCMKGCTTLSKALCINRSLEWLQCMVGSSRELKVLLEPLMPINNNLQANTTLTTLDLLDSTLGGKEGVDILANMIRTNTSLVRLHLAVVKEFYDGNLDAAKNVVAILEALKTNKSLKMLSFWGCGGVGGYEVLGTMMDMLLENHHLETILLYGTPLKTSRDARYVDYELKRRKKMKLWDLIKGMANVSPKSGRVFLCGNPYAGKTTLRMSMKGLPVFQNKKASGLAFTYRGKNIRLNGFGAFKMSKVMARMHEIERTWGIEVDHVECDGISISIWDMAGQTDYHLFHDLVIPNLSADGSCSLFLLICNPMEGNSLQKRDIFDIKREVEYWLRFIASNTRRSRLYKPHVSIVMTHHDHWHNEHAFQRRIEDVVAELKLQFEEVLEFDLERKLFMVDGGDKSCAGKVFDFMKTHLKQLLGRLPKTIKACSEVQCLFAKWNQKVSKELYDGQTSKLPMLKWEDFSNKICTGIDDLQDGDKDLARRKQEFVAISLNDGGHIMYHEEGKFIITNPHWFCHDIMGEFLHHCANVDAKLRMVSAHGILLLEHAKQILMDIMGGQGHEDSLDAILSMMKKLHICYEQDDKTIMIPSTLKEKRERLSWLSMLRSKKLTYVGRRLSCKDAKRTMLSLGFFSRLQVSFFQKFQNNNVGNSYQIFQDVIMFICDGIEVIIEFDHVDVDIMLGSEQCQDKMLEFLENGIVRHIQGMLQNPTLGCPGVILVEHILRPECVGELVEMKDRKDQFVSKEGLEFEVVTYGFDATHNWKQCGPLKIGYDKVKDLLGNKAWAVLLEKRYKDLERYQKQLLQMLDKNLQSDSLPSGERHDSTWTSMLCLTLYKPFEFVRCCRNPILKGVYDKLDDMDHTWNDKFNNFDNKLDVVIKKVDDIQQFQQNIAKMQNNLLHGVSSRIDGLMELSIKMQHSQLPKLAYLSEVGHRKLLTRFVPGLKEFQLHLMCESRDGVHVVADQVGCKVNFGTSQTRVFMTMLVWGLKVATILTKIGAHVAGGMGEMVPDFGEGLQLAGLVLDTPGLMDQMSALCLQSLPDDIRRNPRITKDDRSKAEEWLMDVLETRCKEKSTFYQMFGLKRVVYRGVGSGKVCIAWLCDHCEKNGNQSGALFNN